MHPKVRRNSFVMLFALSRRLARVSGVAVSGIHFWLIVALAAFYATFAIAFLVNSAGYLKPMLVAAILVAGFVPVGLLSPRIFFGVITLGMLEGLLKKKNPLSWDEIAEVLGTVYLRVFLLPHLWLVTALFLLGTIPTRDSSLAFWLVAAASTVAGIYILMWPKVFTGHWGKKTIFTYAIGVIVFALLNIPSGAFYLKYLGFDPKVLETSDVDRAFLKFKRTEERVRVHSEAAALESITKKIEAGVTREKLDTWEKTLIDKMEGKKPTPPGTPAVAPEPLAPAQTLGRVTISAPPVGWSRKCQVDLDEWAYVLKGEVVVRVSDGREVEDAPGKKIQFGTVPRGTTLEFKSRTGSNVGVVCLNMKLL